MVGAHYDSVDAGAVDNWSGASLLPSLYEALALKPRRHRFVFAAFSGEERGLVGSADFVKTLTPEEKAAIRAYVNLDCLGMGQQLAGAWVHTARIMQLPVAAVNEDRVGMDDSA